MKKLENIRVRLKKTIDNSYDVEIAQGNFDAIAKQLAQYDATKYAVITDDNVFRLYGERMLANLRHAGLDAVLLSFPAGESSKTPNTYLRLCQQALQAGVDRKSLFIALGGGVVGDVAGFVAATYMRGVPFVQVPTTLLAMVDSSVGGKVAIDLGLEKNSLGAFWQPQKVFADVQTLKTLPREEMQNGFAEAVKTACIADSALFSFIEKNAEKIMNAEEKPVIEVVKRCCEIKAGVVEKDEREEEYRKVLNYGHTIGHAVESLSGYKIPHGRCVAIGMGAAARMSSQLRILSQQDVLRQDSLLEKAGLQLTLPKNVSPDAVYEQARHDKKNQGGRVQFVLLEKLGKVLQKKGKVCVDVDRRFALAALNDLKAGIRK